PFYVVADTARTQNPDLVVQSTRNNRYAYRNESSLLRAEIMAQNWSGPAQVKLFISGNLAGTHSVNMQAGQSSFADFTVRFPRTGLVNYRVEISANGIQERSIANNSYPSAIEVLADKERIVMISDSPGWDNKFILDVIGENNRWEAEHYKLSSGRLYRGETEVRTIPMDNLAALVVINNGALELTEAVQGFIKEAHRRGTGILWQGAPAFGLDLLPIAPSNVTAAYNGFLTWLPAAAAYPMLGLEEGETGKIPPIDYYYVTAKRSAETVVAINNPQSSPAIVVDNGGTGGKVMALSFLNLWKWQLQGSSGAFKRLVSESLTWLSNRSNGSFQPLYKNSYFMGEEILIRLRADDSIRRSQLDMNPRLKIMDSEGKEIISDYLTRDGEEYFFKANLDKPGDYRFEIRDAQSGQQASGSFSLNSASIEDRDYDYNLPLLAWIASESGGRIVDDAYRPIPGRAEERIESRELPIYRKWYLISLFILAFCLELFFRRRWGLL
ncbi:MAG TPA: CARDB domain-containing protein, partial [Candidatus Cloacimonadota bacterium]|nr:CARDB domain-containing protein [Candidatus Cloacimonadota bacterium]